MSWYHHSVQRRRRFCFFVGRASDLDSCRVLAIATKGRVEPCALAVFRSGWPCFGLAGAAACWRKTLCVGKRAPLCQETTHFFKELWQMTLRPCTVTFCKYGVTACFFLERKVFSVTYVSFSIHFS